MVETIDVLVKMSIPSAGAENILALASQSIIIEHKKNEFGVGIMMVTSFADHGSNQMNVDGKDQ